MGPCRAAGHGIALLVGAALVVGAALAGCSDPAPSIQAPNAHPGDRSAAPAPAAPKPPPPPKTDWGAARALLTDLAAWDAASPTDRANAAARVDLHLDDFVSKGLQTFEAGDQRHEVAVFVHARTQLEFALIPGGDFRMGSPPDEPGRDDDETLHEVTLSSPFLICRTELTQRAWVEVMGSNPSEFKRAGRPVERMTWHQAGEFCSAVGLSLPTEAQWEYACRAGAATPYFYGDDPDALREHAWYWGTTKEVTAPVGKRPPNGFGLHDMLGNVWEWCWDWYGPYPAGTVVDPTGPFQAARKRVARGASWNSRAKFVRCAFRGRHSPRSLSPIRGLRPVRNISLD